MVGNLAGIITYAKFQNDIFRDYNFTGGGRIFLLNAWALQQCSATALPVISVKLFIFTVVKTKKILL